MKKIEYTITGRLEDKTEPLHKKELAFNNDFYKEIDELRLAVILSDAYTVEITVKEFFTYNMSKELASQYLRIFMGERKYTIL